MYDVTDYHILWSRQAWYPVNLYYHEALKKHYKKYNVKIPFCKIFTYHREEQVSIYV